MPYKLTENPENVSEREYVENVPSFRSTAINSCVCLISQTGDSVLTAVHLSIFSKDNTFINDVASDVAEQLHKIFGRVANLHVLGAIDCWNGYVFWTELQRFYDLQFSDHAEGYCHAYFEGSEMKCDVNPVP